MSRSSTLAALALLVSACAAPRPFGTGVELDTVLYGGYQALSHDHFDGHPIVALEFATLDLENGWGYELLGGYGNEETRHQGVTHEAEYDEVALGVRRVWGAGSNLRKVVGVGGAMTRVENSVSPPTNRFDDHGGALYAHAGLQWASGEVPFDPGTDFFFGLDLRALTGEEYDYAQLAVVLGFGR